MVNPTWNVPDTLTPGQAPAQQPLTPYAAYRAKNPLPAATATQPVTAPQNQMPAMPRQQTPIGYGVPGNPTRQQGF
jgi:hypothetical protein